MKKFTLFFTILIGLLLGNVASSYAQSRSEILNEPLTTSRTVEATEFILLQPGFSVKGTTPFIARIVAENNYDVVVGNPYAGNEMLNWVSSTSYDLSGNLAGSGVSYFNTLGKPTQSHALDIKTGKIWVTETRYDAFNRPALSTLSAPVGTQYGYKSDFIKTKTGSTFNQANLESITDNNASEVIGNQENTLGWYYSENNTSEQYQDVTAHPYSRVIYSKLNPGIALNTFGGNKIKRTPTSTPEWLQSYSFTMPLAQEMFYQFGRNYFPEREVVASVRDFGKPIPNDNDTFETTYTLRENCTGRIIENVMVDRFQLTQNYVYKLSMRIVNRDTNTVEDLRGYFRVDNIKFGGGGLDNGDPFAGNNSSSSGPGGVNEIRPFATLLDSNNAYNCPLGKPSYIQGKKTIVRDVNGVESVVFKDGNGNVLAAARSGNEDGTKTKRTVVSPIGKQGFVDIHIPVGCEGEIRLVGNNGADRTFEVTNLATEEKTVPWAMGKTNIAAGAYRISFFDLTNYNPEHPYVKLDSNNRPTLLDPVNTIGVQYQVNYYDYSLNYYDKANRLTKSTQPIGINQETTFTYNTLGQLLETSSPDEGNAEFKYRKDGQIRFSQNAKQKLAGEFSYSNYDTYGRPVESGVATGTFTSLNPDADDFSGTRKEQHFTEYDVADTGLQAALVNAQYGSNASKYQQKFVAGNVSKTYTSNPSTTTTWYSYDVYGRVTWIIQKIDGLGVKSIDYEYDFAKGQVTNVIYQKYHNPQQDVPREYFEHKYTYNVAGELFKVETKANSELADYKEQAKYNYYETGALKRVEIAENVQGIDYIYNLNGQLKAINHPSRSSSLDPGKDGANGMPNDLFGFAIDYYNGDYTRTNTPTPVTSNNAFASNNQYNGNIKATRWSTQNIANGAQASQLFSYNKNNWLQQATFGSATNTGTITQNAYGNYKVYGLEYDANGNIKKLNRNKDGNASNAMDRMTYHYKATKPNQLDYVDDTVNAGVNDMKDQNAGNYVYNNIGQLIENKGDAVKYEYNASGLVTKVFQSNKLRVQFDYNDKGFRVRKRAYTSTGSLEKETFYVRDAAGSPMAIITPKTGVTLQESIEQPIYGASRLGVYNKKDGSAIYQITDHLGNVRATVGKTSGGQVLTENSSSTDYYPFGMAMPNRQIINGEPYRYAYQGQEKDPETGKEAFQLRLWDARIGRWLTTDPKRFHHSPYLGMGNNPIFFIDSDGGKPTPHEAAVLASHVYNGKVKLIGGWKQSSIQYYDQFDESDIGLKAKMYERKLEDGTTEYAFVYAGTEHPNDWKDNGRQAFGTGIQYSIALRIATEMSVYFGNEELTFVGHSLGGGLSNYSSIATGRASITFDPAWLSDSSLKNIKSPQNQQNQVNFIPKGLSLHEVQNNRTVSAFVHSVGVNLFVGNYKDNFRVNLFNVHDIDNITKDILKTFKANSNGGSKRIKSPRFF